jgi:hypothetical protein
MPTPRRRSSWRWAAGLAGFLIVIVAALLGVRLWVYHFLRSDDFRRFLEEKVSVALRADSRFEPLRWQGTEVYSLGFDAVGRPGSPVARLGAEQIRAALDLRALWQQGVWRVDRIDVQRCLVELSAERPDAPDASARASAADAVKPKEGRGLAGLLPSRVEIGEVRAADFSLAWNQSLPDAAGRLRGARLAARPRGQGWEIDGQGGVFEQAHFPSIQLQGFAVKGGEREVFITRAEGQPEGGGHVEIAGRQALDGDRSLDLEARFEGVPASPFLPEDWRARVSGLAAGTVRILGSASAPRASGHVELRDGTVVAVPLLDQLALFTTVERYRQTRLQKAAADFEWTAPGVLTVRNLLVESEGLLRLEGGFTVRDGKIDGTLQVGLARSTVRWLMGAGTRVFNQPERDGYVWTTMKLEGPANSPREDLTRRLLAASQAEIMDKAKKGGNTLLDTATDMLNMLRKP